MGESKMQCPNCGGDVTVGTLLCPGCGVNIRTGETFDARVKRAKPKELHGERLQTGIYFGVTLAFAVVMVSGYLFQTRIEKVIRGNGEAFAQYVKELEEIDSLLAQGKKEPAAKKGEALIKALTDRARSIRIEDAPTTRQLADPSLKSKGMRKAEKNLLYNLAAKVKHRLPQLELPAKK